jgi:hypothetical protein
MAMSAVFDAYVESVRRLVPVLAGCEISPCYSPPPEDCKYPPSHLRPLDGAMAIDWQAFAKVGEWISNRSRDRKPWLLLHGPSRAGKTRAAIMAGVLLDWQGRPFEMADYFKFIRAVDFAREVAAAKGGRAPLEMTAFENADFDPEEHDPECPTEGRYHFNGVVFDDLDKMTFTDAVLRTLFDLVDHAEQNERPMIFTTQATGPTLFDTMAGEQPTRQRVALVESIMGRLVDHSEIIGFRGVK